MYVMYYCIMQIRVNFTRSIIISNLVFVRCKTVPAVYNRKGTPTTGKNTYVIVVIVGVCHVPVHTLKCMFTLCFCF